MIYLRTKIFQNVYRFQAFFSKADFQKKTYLKKIVSTTVNKQSMGLIDTTELK